MQFIDMLKLRNERNNKYIKKYNKNKESSYLKYWNVNNLYGWAMSQRAFTK